MCQHQYINKKPEKKADVGIAWYKIELIPINDYPAAAENWLQSTILTWKNM